MRIHLVLVPVGKKPPSGFQNDLADSWTFSVPVTFELPNALLKYSYCVSSGAVVSVACRECKQFCGGGDRERLLPTSLRILWWI